MESERHKETYVVDTASSSLSRILTITDGSGTTTLCIYGQGLICEKTGDIYRYHHYNNLGSTMKLTDAKGGVTASFTYGTYGELLSGSTGFTRFLYNGRCGVITDENGLYYMRLRYYSPELKRFVNQDVIRGSLDNSQSLNRYSYVQGNPVSYTDPFGLSPLNGLFTGTTFWHGVLGLLGCIPGPIGAAANFVDGCIYLSQKDYFGAALCFVNSVTLGTTALAAKLIEAGKLCKVANTALRVAMVSERIGGALTFAQNFYNIGKTGIQMYCKYGILGESLGLDTAGEVLSISFSIVGCVKGLQAMGSNSKELLALQERIRSEYYNPDGSPIWPPNKGFEGNPTIITLKPGTLVDRYGYDEGTFVSPKGTPYKKRALPAGTDKKPYTVFEIVKPVEVKAGKIASWFGEKGGGVQYEFYQKISDLLKQGILRKVEN